MTYAALYIFTGVYLACGLTVLVLCFKRWGAPPRNGAWLPVHVLGLALTVLLWPFALADLLS